MKQIIEKEDAKVWSLLRKNYLPSEYHDIYRVITSFYERFRKIPSFTEIQLDVRDKKIREQLATIQFTDIDDIDPSMLLEFLKNQYAQELSFKHIKKLIEESRGFETASDTIDTFQNVITDIREKIDLEDEDGDQQRVNPFESEEEINNRFVLGLNAEFDSMSSFKSDDYIMLGGYRGSGKTVVCCNICTNIEENGGTFAYFGVEMKFREIMQRNMSISLQIDAKRLKNRNLSVLEWEKVAQYWANRYEYGEEAFKRYMQHRNFDEFHNEVSRGPLRDNISSIIYDPNLTVGRIRSELDIIVAKKRPQVIVVDYMNEVLLNKLHGRKKQYEWDNQVAISREMKIIASDYNIPVISPYQTDKDGGIKVSKAISNPADYLIKFKSVDSENMLFESDKTRGDKPIHFISKVNWDVLSIGPENGEMPSKDEDEATGEDPDELDGKPF